jgi:predicted enzyme related to lactoylglutathione lyase
MLCEHPTYATIPASDLSRAREFYEKTLGLDVEQVSDAGVLYRSGGAALFVYAAWFKDTEGNIIGLFASAR